MIAATALYSALQDAKDACPPDCTLILEVGRLNCAAAYRRTDDFSTHNVFFTLGRTEAEALTRLAARARGEEAA